MTLDGYMATIAGSTPADWTTIAPQPYLVQIGQVSGGDAKHPWLEIDRPHTLLIYRRDLRISVALGRHESDDFNEDWATRFPDRRARTRWADFLFGGSLIFSELYVTVDGGRAILPMPHVGTREVPELKADVWRRLNGSGKDFDEYFRRAGLQISSDIWPTS